MRRHLSYANVTATLALVLATSGGALAASHYLINSTRQINPKVLKKLRGHTGPRGEVGPEGPQGHIGATGPRGVTGGVGPEGVSSLGQLPSGRSESGVFGLAPDSSATSGTMAETVSFPLALAAALPATQVLYNAAGTTSEHCKGPGEAAKDYLCLYSTESAGVAAPKILDPEAVKAPEGTGTRGFLLRWEVNAAGAADYGTYTITAP